MLEGMQKLGRALMLPIAVLPVAAVLLRLGAKDLLDVPLMFAAGEAVFANLALVFAVGVAVGFARDEEGGAAALAGAVGFLVFRAGLAAIDKTVDLGVLGGILMGLAAAGAANRCGGVRLPPWLAFFGGRRFAPIVTAAAGLAVALASAVVYPPVQTGLRRAAGWVIAAGPLGAGVYGLLNRLLIPTGLHHILNNIVWFQFGDYVNAAGATVHGDLQRFFAGDPSAGLLLSGFFPIMIFGLPGACLAMYVCADTDKRPAVGGLLAGVALTAMVTGVTEPVEYLFMFLAPGLYAVHALLTGLSLAVCDALGIRLGFGFSAGAIDYALSYGLGARAWLILPLGAGFFCLYGAVFVLAIRVFDLKTPGRGEPVRQVREAAADAGTAALARECLAALGGAANLAEISACITRLRLRLRDRGRVDAARLTELGALGLVRVGATGLQVVLGPTADLVARALRELVAAEAGEDARTAAEDVSPATAGTSTPATPATPAGPAGRAGRGEPVERLVAPVDGEIVALEDVPDPVFAAGTVGDGLAIAPTGELAVAPAAGVIGTIFATNHAFSLLTDAGVELFVHVGIDTVKLGGAGFTRLAAPGDRVNPGDPVLRFDARALADQGVSLLTPVVVSNIEDFTGLIKATGRVRAGRDTLLTVVK
jgi:PTS system N-acetylglucosamine-specific IIC component